MTSRRGDAAALTAWRPAVAASHAGGGSGLVQEHEAIWIEIELTCKPGLAGRSYVLSLLLSCVHRPFFRVIRCRAKKRDRLLVLTATPCS